MGSNVSGSTADILSQRLAFHIVPSLVKRYGISFHEILAIGKIVPVREQVFATVILDNEAKTYALVRILGLGVYGAPFWTAI